MRRHLALLPIALIAGACATGTEPALPPITAVPPTTAVGTAVASTTTPTGTTIRGATTTTGLPESVVANDRTEERMEMVERQLFGRGISNELVTNAMLEVPRHRFVPERFADQGYGDHPLPIGHGQTISQPVIVAIMSAALELEPGDKVLEIGTGSGYQAAVLAAMGMEVYSIEIIPELAAAAKAVLDELGYAVEVRTADGYYGWEDHAPYDGIIVTAAPDHVPQPLVEQLAPDAALVVPVGPVGAVQTLWRFTLDESGEVVGESLGDVAFVPFTRTEEG